MKKIAVIVLLILILGSIIWYGGTKAFHRSHTSLSEDRVSQMIIEKYGGTIKNISLDQENYKLSLIKDQFIYDITVNRQTGKVLSFVKQTSPEKKDSHHLERKQPQKNKKPTTSVDTPITIEKAKQLALEKVSGTINSIKLDEEDGQLVYEVDIDQTKAKKAEVIINAYSGKIESITLETNKDD
jgi:uncharacterized membrane protein YkoI